MQRIAIIPARYASTRLPGKPLLDICGKPMLQRVYEQALQASMDRVIIATDDARIYERMIELDCDVCMTATSHQSGTDRLAEVAQMLCLSDDDIVVNVQGDEPLIPPMVIDQVAQLLEENPNAAMSTLSTKIDDPSLISDPNVVKVISNREGQAMYFSRSAIPFNRDSSQGTSQDIRTVNYQRHIGIYGYRAGFLKQFSQWPVCEVEQIESLEQLRVLYNGKIIQIAQAISVPPEGVDTQQDLEKVRAIVRE